MLTYNERIELREKLTNGEISLELAKELYWKDYKEGRIIATELTTLHKSGFLPFPNLKGMY